MEIFLLQQTFCEHKVKHFINVEHKFGAIYERNPKRYKYCRVPMTV